MREWVKSAGIQSWASFAYATSGVTVGKLPLLAFPNTKRIAAQAKGIHLDLHCAAPSAGVHYADVREETLDYSPPW